MCRYPKSLNFKSTYIYNLIEKLVRSFNKANSLRYHRIIYFVKNINNPNHHRYNIKNKGKLVYRLVVLPHKVIFINVQLFKKHVMDFITNIIKQNRKNGNFKLPRSAQTWGYYKDLVPQKIYKDWSVNNCFSVYKEPHYNYYVEFSCYKCRRRLQLL